MADIPDRYIQNSYAALMNLIDLVEAERQDLDALRKMVEAAVTDLQAAKHDVVDAALNAAKSAIATEVQRVDKEVAKPVRQALTSAKNAGTTLSDLKHAARAYSKVIRRSIFAIGGFAIASMLATGVLTVLYIAPFSRTSVDVASLVLRGKISGCVDSKNICFLLPQSPRVIKDAAGRQVLMLDNDSE
ncbi:hypothetical protein SAMN02800694_1454 [Luteibacter sp. UNCMF331Sha3.1]|uniref:hypothetical protein n=1 Tax=Luteibacter sp. UNCMF331Sha3.1 TaxID=1502760 RepID=UPI0008CE418B|nr:hypothetical protein [Luteibacter sp. UNCMF331Sha3.1]SEM54430.1 hypothetical protein SAMN02800694_1454 [Luteibacter sp. UNCMF331Sha3.1]